MQNIDKIAIALAALILVGGFSISALLPDEGGKFSADIDKANQKIDQSEAEQDLGDRTPPAVESEVKKAFSFQGEIVVPEWSFYRRPARLDLFKTEVALPPTLLAARISTVSVVRDATDESTQHRVSGRHAIFERAEIVSCNLEVRAEEGAWEKIRTVSVSGSGAEFELLVDGLEPGTSYSYRILTRGLSASSVAFSSGQDQVTSDESDAVLFPSNSVWRVSGAQIGRLDSAGNLIPGRVTVQYSYWDWKSSSAMRNTSIISESPDGKEPAELFNTGLALERIQNTADGRVVVLKSKSGKRLYLKNNDDPLPLDPSGWENLDPDPAVDSSDGDEAESETEAEAPTDEAKPEPPAKPRSSGGGLFGGDDR
ncbi:MAG: hypothetical protein VX764_02770 [Planctomycetota bacterium]|nr:hypothetical protein [Planctomycetota bacterium]